MTEKRSILRGIVLPLAVLAVAATALGACVPPYPYQPYNTGYNDQHERYHGEYRDGWGGGGYR
jgi:hypothetical protein